MIKYNRADKSVSVQATSPINIALIKYWGKADEKLIIPANSSLSITIDQGDLCSKTIITLVERTDESQEEAELILNGKKDKITDRIRNIINILK